MLVCSGHKARNVEEEGLVLWLRRVKFQYLLGSLALICCELFLPIFRQGGLSERLCDYLQFEIAPLA